MTKIELRNVNKHFGAVHVINDVNLTVADREFVVFLGQSGCGKTTTLRAIAGLETIDSGEILIGRAEVIAVAKRHVGWDRTFPAPLRPVPASSNLRDSLMFQRFSPCSDLMNGFLYAQVARLNAQTNLTKHV